MRLGIVRRSKILDTSHMFVPVPDPLDQIRTGPSLQNIRTVRPHWFGPFLSAEVKVERSDGGVEIALLIAQHAQELRTRQGAERMRRFGERYLAFTF